MVRWTAFGPSSPGYHGRYHVALTRPPQVGAGLGAAVRLSPRPRFAIVGGRRSYRPGPPERWRNDRGIPQRRGHPGATPQKTRPNPEAGPVSLCVHIVDSAFGVPAADVDVLLRQPAGDDWRELVRGRTGQDGRLAMLGDRNIQPGIYQVVCDLDAYYAVLGSLPLHPRAIVEFRVTESDADIHLPIVVSTHSFLSYRGA
ncbi:hydroxyisourate hydrolase [Streptomyces sp. NPDC088197]|uniref:hydroxyisourate hydrolase n=1 Tax=unclassified Streptomyces TaxID=2593676 RepID=UPI0033AAB5E2